MVRKQKPVYASNRNLVAFRLAICAGLIAIYGWRIHIRSQREEWAQTELPVSEFRTVLTQVREGMRGTAVVYRAEAHVSYVAGGKLPVRPLNFVPAAVRMVLLSGRNPSCGPTTD